MENAWTTNQIRYGDNGKGTSFEMKKEKCDFIYILFKSRI